MQTPMGKGTAKTKLGELDVGPEHVMNYVGHAFETRFLLIAALKDSCQPNTLRMGLYGFTIQVYSPTIN